MFSIFYVKKLRSFFKMLLSYINFQFLNAKIFVFQNFVMLFFFGLITVYFF